MTHPTTKRCLSLKKCCALITALAALACLTPSQEKVLAADNFIKPTITHAAFTSSLSTTPGAVFTIHVMVDHGQAPEAINDVGMYLQRTDGSYLPEALPLSDEGFGVVNDGFWGGSFGSSLELASGTVSALVYARSTNGKFDTQLLDLHVNDSRYFDVESPTGSSSGIGGGFGGGSGSGSGSTIKTADGHASVLSDTAYTPDTGFGWVDTTHAQNQLGNELSPLLGVNPIVPQALVNDCVSFYKNGLLQGQKNFDIPAAEFRVDFDAPGTYRCVAYLGNNKRQLDGLSVTANGENVATNLRACATKTKGNVSRRLKYPAKQTEKGPNAPKEMIFECFGGYTRISFVASTSYDRNDETHSIVVGVSGSKEDLYSHPSIAGFEFHLESPKPLMFDQSTFPAQVVLNPDYSLTPTDQSALADFLSAFDNPSATVSAEDILTHIQDDLARANASLWLVGWLDGSEEHANLELLEDAIETLHPLADSNTAARDLLHDALNFRHAVGHLETRGYTQDVDQEYNWPNTNPNAQLNNITRNLSLADQFLRQIYGDGLNEEDGLSEEEQDGNVGHTLSGNYVDTSPLYPRAQFLRARLYYSIATKVVRTDAWTFGSNADHWTSIIERFSTEQFPNAFELNIWLHMAKNYYKNEGKAIIEGAWKNEAPGKSSSSDAWVDENDVIDHAWWIEHLALACEKDTSAPDWANAQRDYSTAFRGVADWWIEKRLKTADNGSSQLGTGADDDEGAGQLAFAIKAINEQARHGELTSVMDLRLLDPAAAGVLIDDGFVDYDEGYVIGKKFDTEHSGEYTTNRLMLLYQITPEDDMYLPKNQSKRSMYREIMINLTQNLFNDECNLGETGETLCNDNDPWTVKFESGGQLFRHLRSRFINGDTVYPVEVNNIVQNVIMADNCLNYRALVPTFFALNNPDWDEYQGKYGAIDFHSIATKAVLQMAQSWVHHVMAEESGPDGKPMGIPPAAVWVAENDPSMTIQYGWPHQYTPAEAATYCQHDAQNTHSDWWRRPGYKDFYEPNSGNGTHDLNYLYQLFIEAYRLSAKHPELGFDRIEFLKPFLYGMRHATDPTITGVASNPECDSQLYAKKKIGWVIKQGYAEARTAIFKEFGEGNLPSLFTEELLNLFEESVTDPYIKYLISIDGPQGEPVHGGNNPKSALIHKLKKGTNWLNHYWPLATNSVTYTDRIYLEFSARKLLYTCQTGQSTTHTLTPPISWSNNPSDPALYEDSDMAILVREIAPESFEVLLYNFKESPQDLDFQIWSTLNFGDTYDVELGNVQDEGKTTESFTPSFWGQFTYDAVGKASSISVAPKSIQLLKITKSLTQGD